MFKTTDPIVLEWRDILLTGRFGWVKFSERKNAKAYPAFLYPPDEDGKSRAQKVSANGYVCKVKNIYFPCKEDITETEKGKLQLQSLKLLNKNFGFSFV